MTTVSFTTLIVIYVIQVASAEFDFMEFNCKIIDEGTPHYQLKRHLFCDYDPGIRPENESKNKTVVDTTIFPRKVTFDERSGTMDMHSWLFIEWDDPFLTWNPEDHGGIKDLYVRSREVWTPEVFFIDPHGQTSGLPETSCKLKNTGHLGCIPSIQYSVPCVSDYTRWPWDVHNCTMILGFWAYTSEQISFKRGNGLVIDLSRDFEEWKMSFPAFGLREAKSKLINNATLPTFMMSVVLSRTQTGLKSVFITPVIILTVMTLTIVWLRPGSTERVMLCCFNFLGHLMALRHIHYRIPDTGNDVPNILIFYTTSLILSSIVLILSCCLQNLLQWKREVPVWLALQVSIVLTSKVGQILSINILDPKGSALLQEDDNDNSTLVDSEQKKSNWENVVTVIGWFSLFGFGFIYLIMCFVLLR
ncbi:neuronal acetylcholine receptor subunit alpha-5-like isoform X2 [Diachasmimorpha longicaudata]|uniref:neuronal acetylcholine receptor subunit alpha-5-like isoform X2 n=1 Tax=Diachasmimorpha longicaudata TaxID=58733 RepID=UPI0030B8A0C3